MNILFVCTGNISRSFLAEMLLKDEIRKHNLEGISVLSSGISAYPGTPADPEIVKYLSELEVPIENHGARPITREDVNWADLILVMERIHFDIIGKTWPEAKEKMELLGKYVSEDPIEDDIMDPFGRSPYHYRVAQSQITLAIRSLIKKLLLDSKK